RRRQLRAGRRALPYDRPPERHRAGDADGRRLRQGLWLVAEERLILPCGSIGLSRDEGGSVWQRTTACRAEKRSAFRHDLRFATAGGDPRSAWAKDSIRDRKLAEYAALFR